MKRRVILGLAAALIALVLLVVGVGWEEVLSAIRGADQGIYAGAFLAVVGTLLFRTLAWHRVLGSVGRQITRRRVFGVFLSATFLKYATPYGQVAATPGIAYVLSKYSGGSFEGDFAAVVSGDFINYLPYYSLGSIGLVYLLFGTGRTLDFGLQIYVLPVIITVLIVGIVLLWYRRSLVERGVIAGADGIRSGIRRISPRVAGMLTREQIRDRLQGFYNTLDLLATDRRSIITAVIYGHLGWLGLATSLYIALHAIGSPVAFPLAMLAVALSKLGFLVPTPGGLGGVEATLAGVLVVTTGLGAAAATAGALLFRLAAYWFPFALGGIGTAVLSAAAEPVEAD